MIKHNKNHTELKKNIIKLIDNRHYQDALDLIHQQLYKNIDVSKQEGAFLKADLAGFLIDIGCEGNIENALIKGIEIFERFYVVYLSLLMMKSITPII